jgi:hypothetical protein
MVPLRRRLEDQSFTWFTTNGNNQPVASLEHAPHRIAIAIA